MISNFQELVGVAAKTAKADMSFELAVISA